MGIYCLFEFQTYKMKYIAIFLACIVAAQAATFKCPSYEYWCAHSFHVLPESSYYCLNVPFDNCWIQSSFYKEVLVNFPKKTPFGLEKEKDIDTIVAEMERRFEESRIKIEKGLLEGLPRYQENLRKLHEYYIAHLKQYYSRCVEDQQRVNEKVAEYTRELQEKLEKAVSDYKKAVEEAMSRIKDYQEQIIKQFREACVSRDTRVKSYCSAVDQRSTQYSQCYKDRLNQIVMKKVAFVKRVFTELYSDKVMHADFDEAIRIWEEELRKEVEKMVEEFVVTVTTVTKKMKETFRCAYVVCWVNGCYIIQRSRVETRITFPRAPHTACRICGVNCFQADWAGCVFKSLRTCSKEERECKFDDSTLIIEITRLRDGYLKELEIKKAEWIRQVEGWVIHARRGLKGIYLKKSPITYNDCPATEEEVIDLHKRLEEQAEVWLDSQKEIQISQIMGACHHYEAKIHGWERKCRKMVEKVKIQFDCCVADKKKKIKVYEECLLHKRSEQKIILVKSLKTRSAAHLACFEKFFCSAFGANPENQLIKELRIHYRECVQKKIEEVLKKYEEWWIIWQPKLIEHYVCGLKCSVKFEAPCLELHYKWEFCPVAIDKCVFYC